MIPSHVLTVAVLLSLAASSVCEAAPITNVVFGNLGASVAIYDATAIIPAGGPGDPIAISSSQTISAKGIYQFSFSGVELTNGTNYWIVPNGDVSWYLADGAPTQQNASGYAFTGTLQRTFFWETAGTNAVSVSMSVVPEPSTYALAALGLGVAAVARWRHCKARGGC